MMSLESKEFLTPLNNNNEMEEKTNRGKWLVIGAVLVLLLVAVVGTLSTTKIGKIELTSKNEMTPIRVAKDLPPLGSLPGSTYNIEMIGSNFQTLTTEIKSRGCPHIAHVTAQSVYTATATLYTRVSECVVTANEITVTAMGQDRSALFIVEVKTGKTGLATVTGGKLNAVTGAVSSGFTPKNPNPTYPLHDLYYAVFDTATAAAPTTVTEAVHQWANLFKMPAQIGFEASNGDLTILPTSSFEFGGNGFVKFRNAQFPVSSRKVDGSGLWIRLYYGKYYDLQMLQCKITPYTANGAVTSSTIVGNGWGLTNNNIDVLSGTPKCKIGDIKFYVKV